MPEYDSRTLHEKNTPEWTSEKEATDSTYVITLNTANGPICIRDLTRKQMRETSNFIRAITQETSVNALYRIKYALGMGPR